MPWVQPAQLTSYSAPVVEGRAQGIIFCISCQPQEVHNRAFREHCGATGLICVRTLSGKPVLPDKYIISLPRHLIITFRIWDLRKPSYLIHVHNVCITSISMQFLWRICKFELCHGLQCWHSALWDRNRGSDYIRWNSVLHSMQPWIRSMEFQFRSKLQ